MKFLSFIQLTSTRLCRSLDYSLNSCLITISCFAPKFIFLSKTPNPLELPQAHHSFIQPSIHLNIYHSTIHPSIHRSNHRLIHPSIHPSSTHPSIHRSIHRTCKLPLNPPSIHSISIQLSIFLFIYSFIHSWTHSFSQTLPSTYQFIHPPPIHSTTIDKPANLPIHLSTFNRQYNCAPTY